MYGRSQMQFVHTPVHTIVVGQASSMASLILAGGELQVPYVSTAECFADSESRTARQENQGTGTRSPTRPS